MTELPLAIDWTEEIRAAILQSVDPALVEVYSDVDPQRRYEGKTTIEVGLAKITRRDYIDGTFRQTFNYNCFVRCNTYEEAYLTAWSLAKYDIKRELAQRVRTGEITTFAITDVGVENDVIDKTAGESFTGYILFNIQEPLATI